VHTFGEALDTLLFGDILLGVKLLQNFTRAQINCGRACLIGTTPLFLRIKPLNIESDFEFRDLTKKLAGKEKLRKSGVQGNSFPMR
jgi:hypothetical protein